MLKNGKRRREGDPVKKKRATYQEREWLKFAESLKKERKLPKEPVDLIH